MILLFVGDDRTLIEEQIEYALVCHGFDKYQSVENSQQAYLKCLTHGLTSVSTATLLEVNQSDLDLDLSLIPRLAKSKNLLFIVCPSWKSQTKLGQALKPYLQSQAQLPSNWNKKEIDQGIDFYAGQLGLTLSYEVKEYLRVALNNNFPQLRSGLSTVALLSPNPTLELVRQIIPSEYATAIELKEMILLKRRKEIPAYVQKLKGLVPEQVILASLSTQFTTMMQSAIALSNNLGDREVAKFAEISNVKRLYFIKQEVQMGSVEQFIWLNKVIQDTQRQFQYGNCDLSAKLMLMTCW
ncbi:MAG: hypothetical protein ACRC80_28980 [Waterburya sp.]